MKKIFLSVAASFLTGWARGPRDTFMDETLCNLTRWHDNRIHL